MVTVRRIRIKGFKSRFRVTLYGKEGTYALLASKYRLGELLLQIARAQPIEVRLKTPVAVNIPRGVKPVGKAARKAFTYTPLKPRKKEETAAQPQTATAPQTSPPRIEEVTSALVSSLPAEPKRSRRKKAATAA